MRHPFQPRRYELIISSGIPRLFRYWRILAGKASWYRIASSRRLICLVMSPSVALSWTRARRQNLPLPASFVALNRILVRLCFIPHMQLRREHVEGFQKAYKHDVGEDLTYKEAYEMVNRLVNIFLILERAEEKRATEQNEVLNDGDR